MKRKSGRSSILRRIEELESRTTDGSGVVPDTPQWLAFWQEQVRLYETGQPHVQLTLEGVRAVMQATPDEPEDGDAERDAASAWPATIPGTIFTRK
jgi:hypothetical protein